MAQEKKRTGSTSGLTWNPFKKRKSVPENSAMHYMHSGMHIPPRATNTNMNNPTNNHNRTVSAPAISISAPPPPMSSQYMLSSDGCVYVNNNPAQNTPEPPSTSDLPAPPLHYPPPVEVVPEEKSEPQSKVPHNRTASLDTEFRGGIQDRLRLLKQAGGVGGMGKDLKDNKKRNSVPVVPSTTSFTAKHRQPVSHVDTKSSKQQNPDGERGK